MKLLSNPLIPLAVGIALGAGTGIYVFRQEATFLAAAVRERQSAAKEALRPEKPWDFWTLEIENLASELKDQKATLAVREQAIAAREARLATDLHELEKTRQQVEALRVSITNGMVELEAEEAKNLKVLAKTYGELTPKAAVGIMKKLDEANAVKILYLMKTEAVSAILQEMGASSDPELVKLAATFTNRLRLVKSIKGTS